MPRAYTERFWAGSITSERHVIYVPAGVRWVLRDVVAHASAGFNFWVSIIGVPLIYMNVQLGEGIEAYGHWQGRQVVDAGEQLTIWISPGVGEAALTGYSFQL